MSPHFQPLGLSLIYDEFDRAFRTAAKLIPSHPSWYDKRVGCKEATTGPYAPEVPPGKIHSSLGDDGAKYVLIGTRFGNIVLFMSSQQYGEFRDPRVKIYLPHGVEELHLFYGSDVDNKIIRKLFGRPEIYQDNIHVTIERMFPGREVYGF